MRCDGPVLPGAALLLAGLLLPLAYGCGGQGPRAQVRTKSGHETTLSLDVVRTPAQRAMGLMFRRSLPSDRGMLFIFESDEVQAFTMKNTFIPLDMIFIDRSHKVVGLVQNARPLTAGPYGVEAAARYVLEVNASFCSRHGLSVGDTIDLQNISER